MSNSLRAAETEVGLSVVRKKEVVSRMILITVFSLPCRRTLGCVCVCVCEERKTERQSMCITQVCVCVSLPNRSRYEIEDSCVPCENLRWGRFSFKGFNPDIEVRLAGSFVSERGIQSFR